jgi:hypothetical protein
MIAATFTPDQLLGIGATIAVVLGGVGYAFAAIRKGVAEATESARNAALDELSVYRAKVERLEGDLVTALSKIAVLEQSNSSLQAAVLATANEQGNRLLEQQKQLLDAFERVAVRTAAQNDSTAV